MSDRARRPIITDVRPPDHIGGGYSSERPQKHPYLFGVFFVLMLLAFTTMVPASPRSTSIHSSYIEAFDTVSRRRLLPVTIERAHTEGLAHWATWVLLIDFNRSLILLQKRKTEGVNCPGAWGVSGEHLEVNESAADTAVRGLREELNIRAKPSDLIPLDNFLLKHRYATGRIDVQNSTVYLYPLNSLKGAAAAAAVAAENDKGGESNAPGTWPHTDDEEFEHAQLVPIATFRQWCEKEPEKLCGRTFAHAYLKYLDSICKKVMNSLHPAFCKEYHFVKKKERGGGGSGVKGI